ncbi:homoserine kinase [Phycisphaerae bacterium RAS1]|nr:homoserine kinase [Phycisphaerae bacterium RAS1]
MCAQEPANPGNDPRTANDRDHFDSAELSDVLHHYDLKAILSAREFRRGSRRSAKLLIRTAEGAYLLKRRAPGRDDPARVAFAHELLMHLRSKQFPAPAPIMTRDAGDTFVRRGDRIYELLEFVDGEHYDATLESTQSAGRFLAGFHHALADFSAVHEPRRRGLPLEQLVLRELNEIPTTISSHDSVVGKQAELLSCTQELYERYEEAAGVIRAAGGEGWPAEIVHGDWHPGNMLFKDHRVCAVLDFDSVGRLPRVLDVATGMLQFSILRAGDQPESWPDFFDSTRMRRFLMGYESAVALGAAPKGALVELMIESLIANSVHPVATTGSLGALPGFGVLQMVRRKVRWLVQNGEMLRRWISGSA